MGLKVSASSPRRSDPANSAQSEPKLSLKQGDWGDIRLQQRLAPWYPRESVSVPTESLSPSLPFQAPISDPFNSVIPDLLEVYALKSLKPVNSDVAEECQDDAVQGIVYHQGIHVSRENDQSIERHIMQHQDRWFAHVPCQ